MNGCDFNMEIYSEIEHFFREDFPGQNHTYFERLPTDKVKCSLKIKSSLTLAGLPYFFTCFNFIQGKRDYSEEAGVLIAKFEGKACEVGETLSFHLPFSVALTAERLALNLITRASAIATTTKKFVDKCQGKNIKILDTRKTTPGLRSFEKYAVRKGGGYNHRFSQNDVWMIKDNHKTIFGGLKQSVDFFNSVGAFYQGMVVEIHSMDELKLALELGLNHLMLDNFSPEQINAAVGLKKTGVTFEVSGGINLENMDSYLIDGVDAISIGGLTQFPQKVDLSLKMEKA